MNEILLRSVPNRFMKVPEIQDSMDNTMNIFNFPNTVYIDVVFKNFKSFSCSKDYYALLLNVSKNTSDEAVKIVLNYVSDGVFKIFDSNIRAVVLREINVQKQWYLILNFANQLKDEDLVHINKFNVYEALNIFTSNNSNIKEIDNDLSLVNNSILLLKYFHILVKTIIDITKNVDENGNNCNFLPTLIKFLNSNILKSRNLELDIIEKL